MLHEQIYTCWHAHQNEGDGKEIKATSLRSAAKKAVDVWRHETGPEIDGKKVTVFLKDEARHIHEVVVTPDGDPEKPEAFH